MGTETEKWSNFPKLPTVGIGVKNCENLLTSEMVGTYLVDKKMFNISLLGLKLYNKMVFLILNNYSLHL